MKHRPNLVRRCLQWAATLSSNCVIQNQFTVDGTRCNCFIAERKRQRCYSHFVGLNKNTSNTAQYC